MKKSIIVLSSALFIIIGAIFLVRMNILPGKGGTVLNNDWPHWRGPDRNGILNGSAWNANALVDGADVLWSLDIGKGFSPVTTRGNRLYAMGNRKIIVDGDTVFSDIIYCLNAKTGKQIWQHSYPCRDRGWPGPRATPTLFESWLYTMSHAGDVHCLNAETGEVVWYRNIVTDSLAVEPEWGLSGSPVVEGDKLIFNAGRSGLALERRTGRLIWKSEQALCGFGTPVIWGDSGERKAAILSRTDLFAVDVKTGRILWSYPWITPHEENIADPIVHDGYMFISSGYGRGCTLLDITGEEPKPVYEHTEMCNHMTNCILIDGYLYGIHGSAGERCSLRCMNLMSGDILWEEPMRFGSMIVADTTAIIMTQKGDLRIGKISPAGYSEISMTPVMTMSDKPNTAWNRVSVCFTPPVLSGGRLYVRDNQGILKCLDVRS